jgi:hypothetical protein
MSKIAALFVETDGCYFGQPGVEPWDITRDARTYAGPWAIVAHPPCQRWGRFWHGSTRKPHQSGGEAVAQELAQAQPARWLALAQTQLQEGLMSIERAITMPTHF